MRRVIKMMRKVIYMKRRVIKGIVSQDFEWLQMILITRLNVSDVPLEVYSELFFFKFSFSYRILIFKFTSG